MNQTFLPDLKKFAIISAVIILALELFLFNYQSFTLGNDDIKGSIPISNASLNGFNADGNYLTATIDNPQITFPVGTTVSTMYINAIGVTSIPLSGRIYYTTAHNSNYTFSSKTFEITSNSRSSYVSCDYNDSIEYITLTFNISAGEQIVTDGIIVNTLIPIDFSIARVLVLFIAVMFIYMLIKAPFMNTAYDKKNNKQLAVYLGTIVVFIFIVLGVFDFYIGDTAGDIFGNQTGDQVSKELVDAFLNGQVSMLEKPTDALLALDNPYNPGIRDSILSRIQTEEALNNVTNDSYYLWDHLLYNGNYYSCYGIAPVLTLFLPFKVITGGYLQSAYGCVIFAILAVIFLSLFYFEFVTKRFKKTNFNSVICGLIILLFSCGVLLCVQRPMFYEVCELAALGFFSVGLYLLLKSGIILKEEKINYIALIFSSVFFSLGILSRVSFIFLVFGTLVWVFADMINRIKSTEKKAPIIIKYLCFSLIPYVIFGGIQMIYNYLRFGNPLEFGMKYVLTLSNNFDTYSANGLKVVNFFNYIFGVPLINSDFPFFNSNIDPFDYNGYNFFEKAATGGLFFRVIPLFVIFAIPFIAKKLSKNDQKKYGISVLTAVLLPTLITLIFVLGFGYSLRYTIDFSFALILLSFFIIFFYGEGHKDDSFSKKISIFMTISMAWCVITNVALVLQSIPGVTNTFFFNYEGTEKYYEISRLFMFWK